MTEEAIQPGGRALSDPSEMEIVRRAQGGDDLAFEELVNRYGKELFGLALFLTGQPSDAEDVVQETYLAAYEGLTA